jgi:hypothetical protein
MEQKKYVAARDAAQKAIHYSPQSGDSHMTLGFLDYLVGDKAASLGELQTAKKLDPDFRKQWDAEVDFFQELTPIKRDKEFLDKLFR